MAESENILLERFVSKGDAEAFSEIVHRHAGLVYGACLRVLEDKNRAADAVQETFFQLVRHAGDITGSVPGWLHRVATRKAIDVVRRDSLRKRREAKYAANKLHETTKWEDISLYVDEELDSIDDEMREILIQRFFEGRTTTDIASDKGMSQATVSRRIESGIVQLREKLHNRGIVVAVAALVGLLGENAAHAAPAIVMKELGKMALVGGQAAAAASGAGAGSAAAASAATAKAAAGGLLSGVTGKIVTAAAVTAVGVGSVVTYNHVTRPVERPEPHTKVTRPIQQTRPKRAVNTSPRREPAQNTQTVWQPEEVTDEPYYGDLDESPTSSRPAETASDTPARAGAGGTRGVYYGGRGGYAGGYGGRRAEESEEPNSVDSNSPPVGMGVRRRRVIPSE